MRICLQTIRKHPKEHKVIHNILKIKTLNMANGESDGIFCGAHILASCLAAIAEQTTVAKAYRPAKILRISVTPCILKLLVDVAIWL